MVFHCGLPREAKGGNWTRTAGSQFRGTLTSCGCQNFEIGNEIEFVITLPPPHTHHQQVRSRATVNIRCPVKLCAIEHNENGKVGIAPRKIARYEFVHVAATAA